MITVPKWLDEQYLSQLERMAKMLSKSFLINASFRGDEATIVMLLMKAEAWGVAPDYVLANSFFDDYNNICHTGKLYKLILEKSPEISSVIITEQGPWDQTYHNYKLQIGANGVKETIPKWSETIESQLSVTIKVTFVDTSRSSIVKTLNLSQVDTSIRELDKTWKSSPRHRLENLLIRDLCHSELYHFVNGYGMEDIVAEQSMYTAPSTVAIQDKQAMASPPTEQSVLDEALLLQDKIIHAQLNKETNEMASLIDELVMLAKTCPPLNKAQEKQFEHIYNEVNNIVLNVDINALTETDTNQVVAMQSPKKTKSV